MLPFDSDLVHLEEIETAAFENDELALEMQIRVVVGAPNRRVGLATVKVYIAAVVDLYNEQTLAGPHSYRPHPHGKLVEVLLCFLECEQQKHRGENYVD